MLDEVIASTNSQNFKTRDIYQIYIMGAREAFNFHIYEYEHDKL